MDIGKILDTLADGIITFDRKGRISYLNPSACQILGLAAKEALGRRHDASLWRLTDAAGEPLGEGGFPFCRVLQSKERLRAGEIGLERGDGSRVTLWLAMTPLLDDAGEVTEIAATLTDISERKGAERERERLLAELDATISAIAEAVIIYRPDGTILRMNPAAEQLLDYRREDWLKPLRQRTARLQLEAVDGSRLDLEGIMERALTGETITGLLLKLLSAKPFPRWLCASVAPIRTAEGTLVGVVASASDVTSLHTLQEQRDLYIHTISHDLRLPLTVIKGHAYLLSESMEGGEERDPVGEPGGDPESDREDDADD